MNIMRHSAEPLKTTEQDTAKEALLRFAGRLAQSKDPAIAGAARQLLGDLRRTKLKRDKQGSDM
jgi:hypothetical protein